ncbi:hypothetical protein CW751_05530 [Brumimicrobium salinarum]|uniref:Uncharacterized protein n=1 Tax=Brumimicrobium salinarum TaxID=2058658 RepID=A0A2I0R3Y0_9FLAO|nr:hypothetical protein CW751_05530 [Brumimicrobium salinarum]
MNYKLEIVLSGIMILYILIELVRINLFKKDNNDLLAGLISVILLLFGMMLSLRYGLILDYGNSQEILKNKNIFMSYLAVISLSIATFSIFLSIIKFVISQLKSKA